MLRRAGLVALLVMALVIAATALASATGRDSDGRKVEVINLDTRSNQGADLDLGDEGLSVGDRFAFSEKAFRDGRYAGKLGGECVIVIADKDDESATTDCVVTLALRDGQITTQGLVEFAEETEPFTIAVTGGTGDYRTARGEVQVTEEGDEGSHIVITLLR